MNIYDKHTASFRGISAYVILSGGKKVATIAFRNGAANQVFVHWLGRPMLHASAGGGGYDRHTAALSEASRKAVACSEPERAFWMALAEDRGPSWDAALEKAGFTVLSAI